MHFLFIVPPSINKEDINPNPAVVIKDSVVLDCPAVGTPDPEVIWLKDGEPLDYDKNRQYTLQANGKRLHIQSVDEDDDGKYTCVAANEAGSTEQVFDLDVWSKFALQGYTGRKVIKLLSSTSSRLTGGTVYSKTCLKRPLKNRQNKGLNDKW